MKTKLFFIIAIFMAATIHASTLRVSAAGDNSDGSTWAKAYTTIQAALTAAVSGDEIWVAQGTYIIVDSAANLNFVNGVNVYGGFVGTETALAQRSTDRDLTIISQDIAATENFRLLSSVDLNDATTWDGFTFDGKNVGRGVTLSGNCTLNNSVIKNCTRVGGSGPGVYMRSGSELIPVTLSNCDVTNNTIQIDDNNSSVKGGAGIYVTDGSAMAQISNCNITNNTIEGLIASGNLYCVGGGVLIHEGVIQDCYFNENHVINSVNATYASHNFTAGAIAIIPKPTTAAANVVLIDGCTITNSTSVSRGGAILIDPRWSGQYHGNYTISDTKIINNKSNDVAGGILCTSPTVQTGTGWTLNLENCLIANNTGNTGGGMFVNTGMVLNITNATIVNNQSKLQYGGGGIHLPGPGNHAIAATLKNVLFWGNVQKDGVANIGRTQFGNSGQPSTIVFTAIQDYNAGYSGWNTTTLGNLLNLSAANNDAFDGPAFEAPSSVATYGATDALTADWHLTASSVCIDAGDDFIAFDIDGTSRPLGDYSDIGAYEYDATLGLEDVKNVIDFKIYPTLTSSIVNIKTIKSIKQIEIFNMSGSSVLKTKEKETIKVSSFATGMYILKVTFDDNVTTVRRFVKK